MGEVSYVKYTLLILFCFFTGWGEYEDTYGWLCAGEDMYGVPMEFNSSTDSAQKELQIFPANFNHYTPLSLTNYTNAAR
jgi:hypothetical protein